LSAYPLAAELRVARAALRRHHRISGMIARTAGFNVAATAAAALGGIVVARAVGPAVRGEYAAVTSWFGLLLMAGGAGQPAAVCFHVARDPRNASSYVATSRALMLGTGSVVLVAGLFCAPILARGNRELAEAYRIAFSGSVIAFVGASYTFSLQATDMRRWNLVRVSQPLLAMSAIVLLWRLRLLTLHTALVVLVATMAVQFCYAYYWCRRTGLAPGHVRPQLAGPLARYGLSQLAALTPAAVNAYLDQLILSQLVPPADLGRYAVAVSATLLPIPLVSAIGSVAFPRLAARRNVTANSYRMQLTAVAVSAGIASAVLLPVAASAYWLVPAVFGPAYRGAVPLLWLLTPGGIFLACGQVIGDLLRGINRPGLVAMAQGFAATFTVILLVGLLPILGVAAAAVASTIAYGIALAVMLRCLRAASRTAGKPAIAVSSGSTAEVSGKEARSASPGEEKNSCE
jgi:O-antigen/teichoic acid export membrane protein